jgi:hypothetical protein
VFRQRGTGELEAGLLNNPTPHVLPCYMPQESPAKSGPRNRVSVSRILLRIGILYGVALLDDSTITNLQFAYTRRLDSGETVKCACSIRRQFPRTDSARKLKGDHNYTDIGWDEVDKEPKRTVGNYVGGCCSVRKLARGDGSPRSRFGCGIEDFGAHLAFFAFAAFLADLARRDATPCLSCPAASNPENQQSVKTG